MSQNKEISQEAARAMLAALRFLATETRVFREDPSDPALRNNVGIALHRANVAIALAERAS